MPLPLRQLLRTSVGAISPDWVEKHAKNWPILRGYKDLGHKISKLKRSLAADNLTDFFNAASVYISKQDLQTLFPHHISRFNSPFTPEKDRLLAYLGYVDIMTYLESDIMTKVDRATMRVALEGREPFLDQNIIEFALRLPDQWKIKNGQTKYILREILYKYVPKNLIERPKQGFAIPLRKWLQSAALRDNLYAMTADSAFTDLFEFETSTLKTWIDDFSSGKSPHNAHFIWYLYTLYQWYCRWICQKK